MRCAFGGLFALKITVCLNFVEYTVTAGITAHLLISCIVRVVIIKFEDLNHPHHIPILDIVWEI